jgi:type II secretory pathway pseudopilin PulG
MNKRGLNRRGQSGSFSLCNFSLKNSRGQVWVETVIYTLIALVMIGLVLSFVQPKITQLQDKSTLQQSIGMLNSIDNVISSLAQNGPGNSRKVEVNLKAGSLTIDGKNGLIIYSMENSHSQFSEPDKNVNFGNIAVYTHKVNDLNTVNMTLNYTQSYNITYLGTNVVKTLTQASTPYNVFISNNGGTKTQMDFLIG